MGILADRNTRVLIQGITGRVGRAHAKFMLEYNTKVVAGVTLGRVEKFLVCVFMTQLRKPYGT